MTDQAISPVYLWFDMEFTDLDPAKAHILQVAALATDVHLQPLIPGDRGVNQLIRLPDDCEISAWVRENLADLLARCRESAAIGLSEAEQALIRYMDQVTGPLASDIKDRPVLCGNSVHNDWRLASIHFPQWIARLNYRLLDVTSLKLHWQFWAGQPEFDKDSEALIREHLPFDAGYLTGAAHDAWFDILASIAELNFYRKHLLKPFQSGG